MMKSDTLSERTEMVATELTVEEVHRKHPRAFLGDHYALAEVMRLVKVHGIRTIIETGTWEGDTTAALAELVSSVVTIDIEGDKQAEIFQRMHSRGECHTTFIKGNSPEAIRAIFQGKYPELLNVKFRDPNQKCNPKFLFYLDAHGRGHDPLLDELAEISDAGIEPVIVIHDFYNPNHPTYSFDTWDIGPHKWPIIAESIRKIYDGKFSYHYNDKTVGDGIGLIYIEPVNNSVGNTNAA